MMTETRYLDIQKYALAVVHKARKLKPYFGSHNVIILTNQKVLSRPEKSRRLAKWAIELSEFEIYYRALTAKKAHAIVDFLVRYPTSTVKSHADKEPAASYYIAMRYKGEPMIDTEQLSQE